MTGIGNETQIRVIAEQIAEAAIIKISGQHQLRQAVTAEIPAPLKWAAAIVTAIMTVGVCGLCFWIVTTLSDLQQTVTRIDERQKLGGDTVAKRIDDVESRLTRIEVSDQERAHK